MTSIEQATHLIDSISDVSSSCYDLLADSEFERHKWLLVVAAHTKLLELMKELSAIEVPDIFTSLD